MQTMRVRVSRGCEDMEPTSNRLPLVAGYGLDPIADTNCLS